MHIQKTETNDFENYEVSCDYPNRIDRILYFGKQLTLNNVLEADSATGLIVRQVENEYGEPIYTNGLEDISLSNEVKLLLLIPAIRTAFLENGFMPKVIRSYEKNVRVVNRNPTVAIAVNVQQELETADA